MAFENAITSPCKAMANRRMVTFYIVVERFRNKMLYQEHPRTPTVRTNNRYYEYKARGKNNIHWISIRNNKVLDEPITQAQIIYNSISQHIRTNQCNSNFILIKI